VGWRELLQTDVTVTFADHATSLRAGELSPWAYHLLVLGSIAVGRLWRALPRHAADREQR
jgi:hypothetical protein